MASRRGSRSTDFVALTDAQRGQLLAIWILAADKDGTIPADPDVLKKLCYMDTTPAIQVLIARGFIEGGSQGGARVASEWRQSDAPEVEAEAEAEAKAEAEPPAREGAREVDFPIGSDASGWVHPVRRMSESEVLQAWESIQPVAVGHAERRKQRKYARAVADGHTREEVAAAFVGIGLLYPHSNGSPWDLRILDQKFSIALAAARDHPELKERRYDAEFMALTEGAE